MSTNDYIQSSCSFNFANYSQIYDIESICALNCGLAITENNLHVTES